ncbi:bifunctional 5,10-methylenetetrahydrofolate dehydrogenase/5,10-methenyltetrahydrofolate cyclohydrolase [Tsukamurella asaccharolytica]|uniref:Bifunctional protein FolD n=1 Tax=Tsukamurella asaccharolytica TaxID=2592067 RepID=A0A5C5RF70_9ACTN|nr:bifunctional 5,10-methylenetetrahydrofolate dehydrogenase/5,10-methenyltetrahydrofolate cyclohydrolase [Tsukamurella asaccharolytica]TWS21318.1 bifunctional 5,10-methylenetetrahydrofolate dehydrogenase/5,10-methenyltetrahydrofolate cyclohydrolase [Tsukamurella asaccharolytica]
MSRSPILMRGIELAARTNADTAERAARLCAQEGVRPTLATVLVGDDPASVTYVRMKTRKCEQLGLGARHVGLPGGTTTSELVDTIGGLSNDPEVHGILVQHPMGTGVDERAVFDAIAPAKDVDGVTSASFAAMALGHPGFRSCTPGGIIRLLDHHEVDLAGKNAVVVGRSAILGKPMAALLLGRGATVTVCHSRTRDLDVHLATADVVIAAAGRPLLIRGDALEDGVIVVDAGYNVGNVGDVDFESVANRASMITPVPGGVGPMTIAVLLAQTVDAASAQAGAAEHR